MRHAPWPLSARPRAWALAILACALSVLAPGALVAADAPPSESDPANAPNHVEAEGISVQLSRPTLFLRLGAPVPIGLGLSAAAPTTGRLVMTLCDGDEPMIVWRSPEWTLSASERTVDVLLPPPSLGMSHDVLNARVAWDDGSTATNMGAIQVALGGQGVRPLMLGWCAGANGDRRAALALTSLAGVLGTSTAKKWRADARVINVTISVERMPTQALSLCAYDVVSLSADALQRLGMSQLEALGRWLGAGGALAIMADGERLAPAAAEFVRAVAPAGIDAEGRLPAEGPARLALAGLGRCAVVPTALARAADQRPDRAASLFLWRVRGDVGAALAQGSDLDPRALAKTEQSTNADGYARPPNADLADRDLPSVTFAQQFVDQRSYALPLLLMPSGIGVVPFSLVAVIIVLYALAIGPGDWLLLGRFKAHRYTWILFPALSIACALLLMGLANRYLGTNEHRTRLAVLDAGEHGKWLRQDVYEELFTASAGPVRSAVQDAIWTPFESGIGSFRGMRQSAAPISTEPPQVEGMLGGHCETVQQVGQWSPTLRRSLSFVPALAPPITLDQDLTFNALGGYVQALRRRFPALYACCLHGQQMDVLAGNFNDMRSPGSADGFDIDFPRSFSALPRSGYFTLVGQMSPCGGNTSEDTGIYDTNDTEHCLLVIALRDGDTVWMLRRLYHS